MTDGDSTRPTKRPTHAGGLTAELALRDRELATLREALEAERADAQAARAAMELQLREAARASEMRAQLERALAEQRDERRCLLADYERALAGQADEHRAALEQAAATATELRAHLDAHHRALALREAELATITGERDEARDAAADAQTILGATEHRIAALEGEVARRAAELEHLRDGVAAERAVRDAEAAQATLALGEEAARAAAALARADEALVALEQAANEREHERGQVAALAARLGALDGLLVERDAHAQSLAERAADLERTVAAAEATAQAALDALDAEHTAGRQLAAAAEDLRGQLVATQAALAARDA